MTFFLHGSGYRESKPPLIFRKGGLPIELCCDSLLYSLIHRSQMVSGVTLLLSRTLLANHLAMLAKDSLMQL